MTTAPGSTTPASGRRTHVLLDLDGTLSDSSIGIARSLRHAFTACGYPPPDDTTVRAVIGPPFEISLPTLGVADGDVERVVMAYRERYEDVGLFENALYDGVDEMLAALAADHTLAIATAKPEPTARRIVDHFGLAERFAVQVGATMEVGSARRSKAAVITDALARLGIGSGDHVVMVGDRDHDVHGANANDVDCIGVTWGFGSAEELSRAGAMALADSPARVVEVVTGTYRDDQP